MSNITLQPSSQDAFVDSGVPTQTCGTTNPNELRIGEYNSSVDRFSRTLIQFDLSSIPSVATVTLATLSLYYYDKDTGASWSNTLNALRVTSSWTEGGVTWNNQPSVGSSMGSTTCTQATSYGWVSISLSASIMTAIINGTYPNYGYRIYDSSSVANNAMIFCSSEYPSPTWPRPQLYLEYTIPSGSQPAISPFFNFFKNFENPWEKRGGIWQPQNPGLVTI